jgi:hypothetical protein
VGMGYELLPSFAAAMGLIWGGALAALWVKKGNVVDATASIAAWHLYAVAAIQGFLRTAPDPLRPVRARELTG